MVSFVAILKFLHTLNFVLVAWFCSKTSAQSRGDVRLVGGSSGNIGRVEVFFEDRWSTICDRNYAGVAATVCYQFSRTSCSQGTSVRILNQSLKEAGNLQIENVTKATPIALRDVDCGPIYSSPPVTTHILQCDFITVEDGSECSHDDDLAVVCDLETHYIDKPYNSEVRLVGGNTSSIGVLEVFLFGQWGNGCFRGFLQATADTVCRQLGYTHARKFKTRNRTATTVWLKDVTCKAAHPCLNNCFGKHKFSEGTCSDDEYAAVQCRFESIQRVDGSGFFGNPVMCSLRPRYSKTPAYFVAIMSVSSIFWIISSAAVIILAACFSMKQCPCYQLNKNRNTDTSL